MPMYFKNSSSSNSSVLFTGQQYQLQISKMLQNTWYWSNGFTHFVLQDSSRYFFWSTGSSSALNILRKIMSGKKKTIASMQACIWTMMHRQEYMMHDVIWHYTWNNIATIISIDSTQNETKKIYYYKTPKKIHGHFSSQTK